MFGMEASEVQKRIGISRLADVTGLDAIGMPVVAAIRPQSRNTCVCFGKGKTYEDACISAIMESAELYYTEKAPSDLPLIAFRDLPPGTALHPNHFREVSNDRDLGIVPLQWIEARNLTNGHCSLVPWQALSMDKTALAMIQSADFQTSPTGLAAGLEQNLVVLHGLYEVIERDSHQKWNAGPDSLRRRSLVSVQIIKDQGCNDLIEKLQNIDLEVFIWNLTGKTGIPCFMVEITDFKNAANTAYVQGVAADLSAIRAIYRALAEAIQIRLTYISGAREDLDWSDYGPRYDEIVQNRMAMQESFSATEVTLNDAKSNLNKDEAILEVLERLKLNGYDDAYVVDLTSKDDPLHVVKVFVPGMIDIND
jgi:YcaO-like protein with predicted kinase domain